MNDASFMMMMIWWKTKLVTLYHVQLAVVVQFYCNFGIMVIQGIITVNDLILNLKPLLEGVDIDYRNFCKSVNWGSAKQVHTTAFPSMCVSFKFTSYLFVASIVRLYILL